MEPDGAVRALIGGMDYEKTSSTALRTRGGKPGSSFKLYVYATAFEEGNMGTEVHCAGLRWPIAATGHRRTTPAAVARAAR